MRGSSADKKPARDCSSIAPGGSSGAGVAVRKAAGQREPHACSTATGGPCEFRAAPSGAVLHVAQAARRLALRSVAIAGDRKSLAIVFHRDAAASCPRLILERFYADRDAFGIGMLDRI